MFKPRFHSASRLFSRPLLRDHEFSPLHGYGSRRFFCGLFRKRHRARIPLVIAISASTIGIVGLVGLAVDRYGPQGLAPFKTPFETVKPHLKKVFSRKPVADPDEKAEQPSPLSLRGSNPDVKYSEADVEKARCHFQQMQERFKRARASGSPTEMREACFSVIPSFAGNDLLEALGPLTPWHPRSRSTGKGALFDMATETRVYRIMTSDGTLEGVFLAVNVDLDNKVSQGFDEAYEAFSNQLEVWRREGIFRIGGPSLSVLLAVQDRVVLIEYAPMLQELRLIGSFSWCDALDFEAFRLQGRGK